MTIEQARQTLAKARNSPQSFLVKADSPPFNGGTTRPRGGGSAAYGKRPGGGAPVDDTSSEKDHVDNKGSGQHLDHGSLTARRAAVDGKKASPADPTKRDIGGDDRMYNAKPTTYQLGYEQDEFGDYLPKPGSSHFRMTTHAKTGKRPPLAENDPCGTALADCAVSSFDAAEATSYEERESHLSAAMEHLDRACLAHRAMKNVGKV